MTPDIDLAPDPGNVTGNEALRLITEPDTVTAEEIRRFRRDNLAELAFPILLKYFLDNKEIQGSLGQQVATACYAYSDAMLAKSEGK